MPAAQQIVQQPGLTATLRYAPAADKPVKIVFFHGLLGDSTTWDLLDPHACPREYAECFYLDFHFQQPQATTKTFAAVADETVGLLRAVPDLDGRPLTLVGNSFGGHLALHLARHSPLNVGNLVLFGPGGIPEVVAHKGMFKSFHTVDRILSSSFERIFHIAGDRAFRQRLQRYKDDLGPYKRFLVRNLISLSRTVNRSMLSHADLERIDARTLLVWGRQDMVTPPGVCEILLQHLPRAEAAWLDCGHAAHLECPADSSRLLRRFCLENGNARAVSPILDRSKACNS